MLVVGASSGIGRAIAIQSVRSGARVALASRRLDLLRTAVEESRQRADAADVPAVEESARGFGCDVTDERAAREMVDDATAWLGGLDILVYAAGTALLGPVSGLAGDEWARMLATNVVGAAMVVARALPELRQAENGTVVLLSSHTVGSPWPSLAAYSASKAALEELGRGLQIEEPGLRVLNVKVGNTSTQFADAWDPVLFERAFGEWIEKGMMRHRVMTSDEVAEHVLASIVDLTGPSEFLVRGEDETQS
jgi:NAD(P)-dependent dehydrogenase (short-subunit alcohol dehydrogenase family)